MIKEYKPPITEKITSRPGAEENKIPDKNSYYRPYSDHKVILISDE